MLAKYKQDLQAWRENPSEETYAGLCGDISNFNGSNDPEITLSILEIMFEILNTDLYFSYDEEENVYQLCLNKLEEKIKFPSKDSPYYEKIIDYVIKLLSLFKQELNEVDEDQLGSIILSVVEFFEGEKDDESAYELFYEFEDDFDSGWLIESNAIIKCLVDTAIQTGNTGLGTAASLKADFYDETDDIYYKTALFFHLDEIIDFSDRITDFVQFFILFDILKGTPYAYLLFDALKGVNFNESFEYDDVFVRWLYEKFKEFKNNDDESSLNIIIELALNHIEFNPQEKELDKEFSFELFKYIVDSPLPIYFEWLKKTNQEQYVTYDKLYYLKTKIENDDYWANEVAKILLKKSSYKQFLKTSGSYFLEEATKRSSNSTRETSVSDSSGDEKNGSKVSKTKRGQGKPNTPTKAKGTSGKKPYRPKGIKGHFYGLYKAIHGKKK